MRILGIDLGSREVKLVIMEDGQIIEKRKYSTMKFYREYCSYNGKVVVDFEKLGVANIDIGVSTGYGRNNTELQNFTAINEIKAHAYGAIHSTGFNEFILLDIGGQDVKVVKVEKAVITDLELNDKCAASCGRYIENMANILEISLGELSKYHADPVELNSTCAVFSESELIGKIAEGVAVERLCAGVNYSLYKRLKPLLTRFYGDKLVLAGGVANNQSIHTYLTSDYDEIVKVADPQYNGAVGCCYYALKFKKGGTNVYT